NTRQSVGFDLRHVFACNDDYELSPGLTGKQVVLDQQLDHGYFDPDNYQLRELYLDWKQTSQRDLRFDARAALGMEQAGSGADWRTVMNWRIGARDQLSDRFVV